MSHIGLITGPIIAGPCIPSTQNKVIRNTVSNPPPKLFPDKNPFKGDNIALSATLISNPRICLITQNNIKITAVGNNAVNEFETSTGTPAGILIVIFFSFIKRYISTVINDVTIAPNNDGELSFAISIHLPASITPPTGSTTWVGTIVETKNAITASIPTPVVSKS